MPRLRHAGHVAPTARRRPAHRHARLQVVNQVGDERDEDEEDQDDQEDDNVALHLDVCVCEESRSKAEG